MENFVLYHEIYRRDGMIMYKGRKKGTITYVAVSCIDKQQRIKVTNHVRIAFELDEKHIVRFYEWYETSNHLWLVTDLCVGGSLQQMIAEDVSFPECSIRVFGAQLIRGLHYLHQNRGIICVQWHPAKIVLDGHNAILKYFDFSDAKKANENHEELVERFFTGLNIDARDVDELFDYRKPTAYTAPELLQGNQPDFQSDIWGLGCILFEMFTGQPPFGSVTAEQITQNIINNPLIIPRVAGPRVPVRASPELTNLLERMLHKNRDTRITMSSLIVHPFWQGALNDLTVHTAPLSTVTAFTDVSVRPKSAVPPGHSISNDNDNDNSDNGDESTATNTVDDVSFTLHLGSRPTEDVIGSTVQRNKRVTNKFQLEVSGTERVTDPLMTETNPPDDKQQLMMIATSSSGDTTNRTKSCVDDYARMLKDGRLKFDGKLLPVSPFSLVKLKSLRKSEREKHLKQLESAVKTVEKGPPSQRRLHLINYLSQLSMSADVSNFMFESGVTGELAHQLRTSSNQELIVRLCQALAIIFHYHNDNSNQLCQSTTLAEVLVIVADVLRDQFRCTRVKIASLTALGEGLIKLIEISDLTSDQQCEPPAFGLYITLINRCLHRNEELATNLIASRIIEIVVNSFNSPLARQIANPETIQQLYNTYKHATIDQLKISSAIAMCRLTRLDCTLFCGLIDKIGTIGLLENLHVALLSVQEAILEMFATVMVIHTANTTVRKLGQDQQFLKSIMRLLETPAAIVRAKSLLLVLLLCRSDLLLLKCASDNRLVLYLERELKRINSSARQEIPDIMEQCLNAFTGFLSSIAIPSILEDCSSALQAVQGRRHPSSMQTKALRTSLPLLECVTNLTSSSSIRLHILNESFCKLLALLLVHAINVDNGQTSIGSDISSTFITHVLTLVESCCHCVDASGVLLVELLLEPLANFTSSTINADIRVIGLKLCGDIVNLIVNSDVIESQGFNTKTLSNAMENCLLSKMSQFILDPDPCPVYLLRLVRNYLVINTEQCILIMKQHAFPHLLVKLVLDHQQRIMAAVVLECLLLISAISQISPDLLRDFVLDVELVPILCDTLLEVGDVYHKDEMSLRTPKTSELLQVAMETLNCLAKFISDVVRRALLSKKNQESDEITLKITSEAEELLGAGKPLTENVDLLIYTLSSPESDSEVVECSIKLLNQIVSLYGGQQIHHGLNEPNLQYLCNTIVNSTVKHRRTLLRILKRLLVSGQLPSPSLSHIVKEMVTQISLPSSQSESDSVCAGLADEISKYLDK